MNHILKITFLSLLMLPSLSFAKSIEHSLIRRVAVFPLKSDKFLEKSAEESWWKIRDLLTKDKKYLVASKNFMKRKNVFQAREKLTPADAIILGQLLDAQALVTTYLKKRVLHMNVYEKKFGRLLWSHNLRLHPSLPLQNQIKDASQKLMLDYMASVPYQGFIHVDALIGKPIYRRSGKKYARIDVGLNSRANIGDKVQFVRMTSESLKPLFGGGLNIEVYAEGEITEVRREILTVEITRSTKNKDFKELGLVRLPAEYKRLRESYSLLDKVDTHVNPEYFSPEITSEKQKQAEKKPLATALSFIANIAVALLLAL